MQNDPFLEEAEKQSTELNYKGFGPRLGALLLDSLFLLLPVAAVNIYNFMSLRSFWLYLIVTVIAAAYKPLMEYQYGATWGKMIVYLRVVDYDGNKVNAAQAILRSVFSIGQTLILLPVYYFIFNDRFLLAAEGYFNFSLLMAERYPFLNLINGAIMIITAIEVIFLLTDEPYWRSLHDRMAKTYVVEA